MNQIIKPEQKCAIFTYFSKEIRIVSLLFKDTKLRTAFRTTNSIKNNLKPMLLTSDPLSNSGIYQLTFEECPNKYVG
jgi:hypothetical protein